MVSASLLTAAVVVAAASTCVPFVDAHGYVAKPPSEFKAGTKYPSDWVQEFGPPWSGTFRTGAQYAAAAKTHGYKNLRAFLESHGPVCGNTNANAKGKAIPADGKVVYSRPMVHPGPCEIWLDNTLVFHNDDCEAKFGSSTPVFPVNFSSCKSKCLLRFYWLGLQDGGKRWQSYKNCVPLVAGASRSIDDGDDEEATPVDIDDVDAESFSANATATTPEEYTFSNLNN